MDVIIRGLDEALYRSLKARAALLGCKVSHTLEEAIRFWLESSQRTVETELDANNSAYHAMKEELLRKHKGKYALFIQGKLLNVAESLDEVANTARTHGAERALITKLGEEGPAGGEWLWSSIELSSA